jgi:hypothetical protein
VGADSESGSTLRKLSPGIHESQKVEKEITPVLSMEILYVYVPLTSSICVRVPVAAGPTALAVDPRPEYSRKSPIITARGERERKRRNGAVEERVCTVEGGSLRIISNARYGCK